MPLTCRRLYHNHPTCRDGWCTDLPELKDKKGQASSTGQHVIRWPVYVYLEQNPCRIAPANGKGTSHHSVSRPAEVPGLSSCELLCQHPGCFAFIRHKCMCKNYISLVGIGRCTGCLPGGCRCQRRRFLELNPGTPCLRGMISCACHQIPPVRWSSTQSS